jgi:hypothetical protein
LSHKSPKIDAVFAVNIGMRYAFVSDRVQAVRQELVAEEILDSNCIAEERITILVELFESMVQFYFQSMYFISSYPNGMDRADVPPSASFDCSSWFDLHLHEQALQSLLATALDWSKRQQLARGPVLRGVFGEFVAYSTLLLVAKALREAFADIVEGLGSFASAPALPSRLVGTLHAAGLVEATRDLAVLLDGNVGPSTSVFKAAVGTVAEKADCRIDAGYEGSYAFSRTKGTAAIPTICEVVLAFIVQVRRGNPAGAVRLLSTFIVSSSDEDHSFITRRVAKPADGWVSSIEQEAQTGSSSASGSDSNSGRPAVRGAVGQRLTLAAALLYMMPELRLWRLLLAQSAANKNETVTLVRI